MIKAGKVFIGVVGIAKASIEVDPVGERRDALVREVHEFEEFSRLAGPSKREVDRKFGVLKTQLEEFRAASGGDDSEAIEVLEKSLSEANAEYTARMAYWEALYDAGKLRDYRVDGRDVDFTSFALLAPIVNSPAEEPSLPTESEEECKPRIPVFEDLGSKQTITQADFIYREYRRGWRNWDFLIALFKQNKIDEILAKRAHVETFTLHPLTQGTDPMPACLETGVVLTRKGMEWVYNPFVGGFSRAFTANGAGLIGIKAIELLEKLHKQGIIFGGQFIHSIVFSEERPGQYKIVLDGLGSKHVKMLAFDPSTKQALRLGCKLSDKAYRMAPGELKGFCPTRYDDMYRLAEAMFKIAGSKTSLSRFDQDTATQLTEKARWQIGESDMFTGYHISEAQAAALNEFKNEMFEHSNDLDLSRPNYKKWIEKFKVVFA
jgi:hypothetical protein